MSGTSRKMRYNPCVGKIGFAARISAVLFVVQVLREISVSACVFLCIMPVCARVLGKCGSINNKYLLIHYIGCFAHDIQELEDLEG